MRAGARRGGRVSSATTTQITVDNATASTIPTGSSATLSVMLPDGRMETRSISGVIGAVVTVSSAFSVAPTANAIWVAQNTAIRTSTWRVLAVTEGGEGICSITALSYNSSKYGYVEDDEALQFRDITNLYVIYDGPNNLSATEQIYDSNGVARVKIILSWDSVAGANGYRIRYRAGNNNWEVFNNIPVNGYQIFDTAVARYQFQVFTINAALRVGNFSSLTFNAVGKTAAPADVDDLTMIPADDGTALLRWTRSTELDVLLGGSVLIRHSSLTSGATWDEAQSIVQGVSGNSSERSVTLLEGTYLLKFQDDLGNRSVNATLVVVDLPEPQPRQTVFTYAEDATTPPFQGNPTNMVYIADLDGLILASGDNVDSMALDGNWDALASIDSIGGVVPTGEYEFGSSYDMGARYDVNLQRRFVTRPYLPAALWDDKLDLIDTWCSIDENNLDAVDVKLYVRTTNTDPAGTPTWSAWQEIVNGIIRGRGFQFKTIATSTDASVNIIIDELGAVLELQQHTERSATLTSGAGTYSVTFDNAFNTAPAIGITGYDMATGDTFTVTSVTRTGFAIVFRNSGGTAVSRNFVYAAVGYGREV